ncbi:MAG: hypothetical protein RLZZ67_113 [Candidatus Parcubacteria bacterium]|jgi:hypothetical protein
MEGTHQNQNKPLESRSEIGLSPVLSFGSNAHFSYLYKKTEKLVTAIYMITNFIKDNEPLKWKFRDNALKLLSHNRAFTNVSLSERKDLIKEYQGIALEIVSLSSIASHGGLISEMNADILSREFTNLISLIEKEENKKANDETVSLSSNFFQVAQPADRPLRSETLATPVVAPTSTPRENVLYAPEITESVLDKGHTPERIEKKPEYLSYNKEVRDKPAVSKSADSKDGRQAVILKLLSKKSGLNIKDFGESIKGVSAKTIQRELLSMVASGVLKKEGERRWSTYSLAS